MAHLPVELVERVLRSMRIGDEAVEAAMSATADLQAGRPDRVEDVLRRLRMRATDLASAALICRRWAALAQDELATGDYVVVEGVRSDRLHARGGTIRLRAVCYEVKASWPGTIEAEAITRMAVVSRAIDPRERTVSGLWSWREVPWDLMTSVEALVLGADIIRARTLPAITGASQASLRSLSVRGVRSYIDVSALPSPPMPMFLTSLSISVHSSQGEVYDFSSEGEPMKQILERSSRTLRSVELVSLTAIEQVAVVARLAGQAPPFPALRHLTLSDAEAYASSTTLLHLAIQPDSWPPLLDSLALDTFDRLDDVGALERALARRPSSLRTLRLRTMDDTLLSTMQAVGARAGVEVVPSEFVDT